MKFRPEEGAEVDFSVMRIRRAGQGQLTATATFFAAIRGWRVEPREAGVLGSFSCFPSGEVLVG
jgi:hypothetical protein